METKVTHESQRVFRLALYGVRASGKTCILSALALPQMAHPDGLTRDWIADVPGNPRPQGDPKDWNTTDPFYRGWKWLDEQRQRLGNGRLPPPNPNAEDVMKFRFKFGAPDHGMRHVELSDYSGELLSSSEDELATRLREHMQECDGLLVLAEVPRPDCDQVPLAEDLQRLRGAFLRLLEQRDAGPQPDWPIAVLFNKWDRREQQDGESRSRAPAPNGAVPNDVVPHSAAPNAAAPNAAAPRDPIDEFLNQQTPPPHASLVDAFNNAVGQDNVRCFPVSAFGRHQVNDDGMEVPVLENGQLRSIRLEDGFVWVMDRCCELERERQEKAWDLEVKSLEDAARAASWGMFWQTLRGRDSEMDADARSSAWKHWGWGVSPAGVVRRGWTRRQRFPEGSTFRSRADRALGRCGLKFLSQAAVFVVLVVFALLVGRAGIDAAQYRRTVVAVKDDPAAKPEALQTAENWLDAYFQSPGHLRWLSHWFVLGRREAHELFVELRTRRDHALWDSVAEAENEQTRLILAREYLETFPTQGLHSQEARLLVADADRQQREKENDGHLKQLALKIGAIPVASNTDLARLDPLHEEIGRLPHPEATSSEIEAQQQALRKTLAEMQSAIIEAGALADWEKFRQTYLALMRNKDVQGAAKALVSRASLTPREPKLQGLKDDFAKDAPGVIRTKVQDALKNKSWRQARDAANLVADGNVGKLLSTGDVKELKKLSAEINEKEDQDLYAQVVKYKPQCADQVDAYLSHAPLKAMETDVKKYRDYLARMKGPFDLTLTLSEIRWHKDFGGYVYNYDNDVTVLARGKPLITKSGVRSTPNERSGGLGDGTLQARLNESITIDVAVVAKYGLVKISTTPGGSGSWTGTPDQLRSGVTIDLAGKGFTNKATFSLSGVPAEPKLPQWTRP